jgi:2-polyprenyl-3-methyl-5-hydroxy-6-metoxy-1,4-benzoquinol methylase
VLRTGHALDDAAIRARYESLTHRGGLGPAFVRRVISLAGPPAAGRVVDVGCGGGELLAALAEAWRDSTLYGVEVASRRRAAGSIAGRVRWIDADLGAALPLVDRAFEVVFCTEVLEHLKDPVRCLRELRRVLVPGGRLVLSVPNATGFAPFHRLGRLVPGAWLRGKLLPYEHPANTDQPIDTCWTYGEIVALVRAGGFAIDARDGLAYFRYLEMLPVLRDAWRPVAPAAERLLPRLGGRRFAYHVLLRCRPAAGPGRG